MAKTYVYYEQSSSLNVTSRNQVKKSNALDKVREANKNFALQSTRYDYYRDNEGTNWVVGWLGKSEDDSEWRIWTTYKTPRTADDANYIAEKLTKSEATEIFDNLIGKAHEDIMKSFQKALRLPKLILIEKAKTKYKKKS